MSNWSFFLSATVISCLEGLHPAHTHRHQMLRLFSTNYRFSSSMALLKVHKSKYFFSRFHCAVVYKVHLTPVRESSDLLALLLQVLSSGEPQRKCPHFLLCHINLDFLFPKLTNPNLVVFTSPVNVLPSTFALIWYIYCG